MGFRTTANVDVKSARSCVLFDPSDGKIMHVHHVVTMTGAQETSEQEAKTTIVHFGKQRGLDIARLKVLHVNPAELAPSKRYTVDVKTRTIVSR